MVETFFRSRSAMEISTLCFSNVFFSIQSNGIVSIRNSRTIADANGTCIKICGANFTHTYATHSHTNAGSSVRARVLRAAFINPSLLFHASLPLNALKNPGTETIRGNRWEGRRRGEGQEGRKSVVTVVMIFRVLIKNSGKSTLYIMANPSTV